MDNFIEVQKKMQNAGLCGQPYSLLYGFMCIYNESQNQLPEFYEKFKDIEFIRIVVNSRDFSKVSGKTFKVASLQLKLYSYMQEEKLRCLLTSVPTDGGPNLTPAYYNGKSYDMISVCWMKTDEEYQRLKSHVQVLSENEDGDVLFYKTNVGTDTLRIAVRSETKKFEGDPLATLNDDFQATNYFS